MTGQQWIGLAALLALIGFVVFAFRQGTGVKDDGDGTPGAGPSVGTGTDGIGPSD